MLILRNYDNISDNIKPYRNEKSILKKHDIERYYRDLIDKIVDTGRYEKDRLLRFTFQSMFLRIEMSSSLNNDRFSE